MTEAEEPKYAIILPKRDYKHLAGKKLEVCLEDIGIDGIVIFRFAEAANQDWDKAAGDNG